ncbi:ribonuclease H-like protein [Rickenella mellea]|uniref:ribonuclease H n=1 Tax=Rickenella mellea TaxID=50990 RepID=A0A4Y7Q1I6_9AGAM|nr:ribonuclease H-like protein [Rickenella mellea]
MSLHRKTAWLTCMRSSDKGIQRRRELATTGVVIAQPPGAGPSDSRKYQSNGSPETDIVYTRGACRDNGTTNPMAGIGVWWRENDPRNIFERCPGDQTNNRAELLAVVRALELTPHSKRVLIVKTDSRYVLNSAGSGIWVQKWQSSDSKTAKRDTVKNQPVIEYLNVLLACRQTAGQDVRLEYVKPHSGNPGSDAADFEAQKGALLPEVPEPNWQALIAGVEPDIPAIEDMPVVDDQSDDLDFLVGGLLTPEALDAELNALEEFPLASVASIAVPLERVNIVGPEALAPELTPSPEVPVLVHRSIKLDKRNPIEHTPTQIIIETPSSSSNMIPQSFVSGLSTNSSFRPPERNARSLRSTKLH